MVDNYIYISDEYLNIWADNDNAEPLRLCLKADRGFFEIPLLYKRITGEDNLFEAYTPYGYGGPVLIEGDKRAKFPFGCFVNELKKRNIINALIRFSPFLGNHVYFPAGNIEFNKYTVSKRLVHKTPGEIIKAFSKGTKWAIKKNISSEVKVSIVSGIDISSTAITNFYELYYNNMKALNAQRFYLFSKKCIDNHFKYLKQFIDLFIAQLSGNWLGASIFIKDNRFCHYHLAASDRAYRRYYPMDRILFEAVVFYGSQQKRLLHLGGGLTAAKDNSLFKFKKKFGDIINTFYIGKVVTDSILYNKLRRKNDIQNSKYFLINDALKGMGK